MVEAEGSKMSARRVGFEELGIIKKKRGDGMQVR